MPHTCQRCHQTDAPQGNRFCSTCRKAAIAEMKEHGYFVDTRPPASPIRESKDRHCRDSHALAGAPDMRSIDDLR